MRRALPPSEPPDGERPRCLCLVVEGAQPCGGWYLSTITRLQGFSSCSPAVFPHQWAVWWREASRAAASAPPSASRIFVILAEAEGELSRGLPLRRQRIAPSLSDLGGRAFAACSVRRLPCAWFPGTSGPGAASGVAPHYRSLLRRRLLGGRPTRRTPRGRRPCSGTVPFSFLWPGQERGSAGALSGRTPYAGAASVSGWPSALRRWQSEEVVSADETANSARTPGPPSPWLEWLVLVLHGRGLFRRSVCPEAVATAVLPPGTEVVVAAVGAVASEPLRVRRPAGLLVWRLFVPAGTEPESRL
jgi:hypothetical protein